MDNRILIPVVIIVVALIVIAAIMIVRARRSKHLKQQFGPEYDRTLSMQGDSRQAEAILIEREKRVEKFTLRPLTPVDRQRFAAEWTAIQNRFVDDPSMAVTEADKLVTTVMAARGYPMADFEQRAADISVNYPTVVQNYRSAREFTVRHALGQSTTEQLRQAMVYFRSLFDELLETGKPQRVGDPRERLAS